MTTDLLLSQSEQLCANIKQMLWHFSSTGAKEEYERTERIYLRAFNRYTRRWQKYQQSTQTK